MSLASILTEAKSKLTALLSFANDTTGAADTSIGDAIKTLVDGYGQGGGIEPIEIRFSSGSASASVDIDGTIEYPITVISCLKNNVTPANASAPCIITVFNESKYTQLAISSINSKMANGSWIRGPYDYDVRNRIDGNTIKFSPWTNSYAYTNSVYTTYILNGCMEWGKFLT